VQDNDSLWSIARKTYGDARAWSLIVQANPGLNPNRLRKGAKINLPDAAAVSAQLGRHAAGSTAALTTATTGSAVGPTPSTRTPTRTTRPATSTAAVTVHEGDTLYSIARKAYGDGEKWDLIYRANKDKISNPDELPAGIRLVIPAS
jgi:nucleoid-associated protein YgaU